jgi:fatty acid desaturase
MSVAFTASTREVLEQIVRDARFQRLTQIPLLASVPILTIVGAYVLFAVATYLWLQGGLPLVAMLLLNGFAMYAAFTPLHDATHRTVSRSPWLNDLLGTIACVALLPGFTTRIYRYLDLEHHRYTGDKRRDPDEPFVSARGWLLPCVIASPDVLWTIWYLRHWSTRPSSERMEFLVGIAIYVGFHVAFLTSPYALDFIQASMIPQRIGLSILTWFFARIQHPEGVLWAEHPFQATVRIPSHRWLRYLMFSQTEHCVHHLAPSVPFCRYHEAWELGRALFERQNIPERGFFRPVKELQLTAGDIGRGLQRARVVAIDEVAEGIRRFTLESATASPLAPFTAGAHIDVRVGERTVRQYSICNSPAERSRYVIAVKLELDGQRIFVPVQLG